jgi:hypothetical protein
VRDRFEFPLEIDMFNYTADGLAAADQQQKAAEQQQQGDQQQQQRWLDRQGSETSQQQDGGGTSSSGGNGLLPREPSDSVQQMLSGKPSAAGSSSSGGGSSSETYMYDLMGVVVHSGSAFTGHFYSFIKERRPAAAASSSSSSKGAAAGRWYQFDDKSVTEWEIKDLELECFGGKPSQDFDSRCSRPVRGEYERAHSAYMLFYERRQPQQQQPEAAADASTGEQQQQGVTGDDGDVPMAPERPRGAAAAAAAGEVADAAAAAAAGGIPYNMPLRLYKTVMEHNISLMWQQHVLDKDYFRFVRQLVDSRGDLGQLSNRKSRRRDGSVSTPAVAAGLGAAAAAAGGGSASSSRMPSSMSCDVAASGTAAAAKQQQQQPQVVVDAGDSTAAAAGTASPCPMAISPAPAAAPLAAAAPASNGGLMLSPPTEPQASPGPSSRRGEEADAVAQALLRLGVLFQFQVYLRANDTLRSESNVWTEALTSLMGSGPSSSTCMQVRASNEILSVLAE